MSYTAHGGQVFAPKVTLSAVPGGIGVQVTAAATGFHPLSAGSGLLQLGGTTIGLSSGQLFDSSGSFSQSFSTCSNDLPVATTLSATFNDAQGLTASASLAFTIPSCSV